MLTQIEKTTFTRAEAEARIADFIPTLDRFVAEHYSRSFPNLTPPTHSIMRGSKYVRIVATDKCGSRRVYCFLDWQGNIYKAAGWDAPAKHIRGTIFDAGFSLGNALTQYGAVYLR